MFTNVINFLKDYHGDNTFEIRTIPEGGKGGYSKSIVRYGDNFYAYHYKEEKMKPIRRFSSDGLLSMILSNWQYIDIENSGVFFSVNSPNFDAIEEGKVTDRTIINGGKIVCQCIDIDAPKEIRHSIELINEFKQSKLKELNDFKYKPSFIINTKNGVQVYWLINDGNFQSYRHIQMQLIQHFGGDPSCTNESRVLRLPYFTHKKDFANQEGIYFISYYADKRYSQEDLMRELPILTEQTYDEVAKHRETRKSISKVSVNSRIIKLLLEHLDYNEHNENKIKCYCCMPDHDDNNPSAWFDLRYNWYHCAGCGTHLALDELAEYLNWEDVLCEINRYDATIDDEIYRIKQLMVDVDDIPELQLSEYEHTKVTDIYNKIVQHFESIGQFINEKHKKYIFDIVKILYKGHPSSKPYLIPLDMGGGKSTIINIFSEEMLKSEDKFGLVVVKERKVDVIGYAKNINERLGLSVAYPLYGFEADECNKNREEGDNLTSCIAMKPKCKHKCSYKKECRYYNQMEEAKKYPIISMTKERLSLTSDFLSKHYRYFYAGVGKERTTRQLLIIDEKPELVSVHSISQKDFETRTKYIITEFEKKSKKKEQLIMEFENAIKLISPLFREVTTPENFEPLDKGFNLSSDFWIEFETIFDYTKKEIYAIPDIIESVIRNGGHIESKTDQYIIISTAFYHNYTDAQDFQTVIFDGTADIDPEYIHENYYLFNFEPLRTYEGLTMYICNNINSSKTSMDEDTIEAFCKDVRQIANENPNEKVFLAVYKSDETKIKSNLNDLIQNEQIKLAHFGETKGSNNFKDCSIIIVQGVLHKTEGYYIEQSKAIYKQKDIDISDISIRTVDNTRRFNDPVIEVTKLLNMLSEYSQEFKRGNQRDNSRNVEGKIYIFHKDKMFLEKLNLKFPNCTMIPWTPKNVLESKIDGKQNNTAIKAIKDAINELNHQPIITYEVLKEKTGLDKKVFSKTMNKPDVQALIVGNRYIVRKKGRCKQLERGLSIQQ
ncbi:DNA-primase RepB domain-containing protein [Paenibacillus elgii]|uniref:DNA-primase RepB domain-containing protein n=1 Tax=Paenibacillus elgii TaxID=189691 RepID=UPI00203C4399|nr:DNA-primase RepB domain-containing protein [Paenibacillus elgii]MCM3271145.1 RepB family DNA primase [Paenibacillus elgii]